MAIDKLADGWRMVKFGEMVREVSVHERNPLENGLERFIGLDDFDPASLQIKRWGTIADGTSFTKKFERGQVLFPKRRVYQRKEAVADFCGICSSDIIVMETKNAEMLPEFLPFLVQSDAFFNWAEATSSGSLSPRTKFKHLAEFQFPLPPMARQRELVEVFDALEATIRCTEEAVESTENLKKSLMAELLTRGIGHTRFKQTEIGEIPEAWEIVRVGDVSNFQPGYAFKSEEFSEDGDRLLRGSNVGIGHLVWEEDDTRYFPTSRRSEFHEYLLNEGDIIVAMDRPFISDGFKIARVVSSDLPAFLVQRVGRFCAFNGIDREYLWFVLQSHYVMEHLRIQQKGTDLPHISKFEIQDSKIPLPPITEQNKVVEILASAENQAAACRQNLEILNQKKTGIIEKLLINQRI